MAWLLSRRHKGQNKSDKIVGDETLDNYWFVDIICNRSGVVEVAGGEGVGVSPTPDTVRKTVGEV